MDSTRFNRHALLEDCPYPGRGVLIGWDESGMHVILQAIMTGRSDPSKQRLHQPKDGGMRAVPVDPTTPFDPTRHYRALAEDPRGIYLATNGSHGDVMLAGYSKADDFGGILRGFGTERDIGCKYDTPRIIGLYDAREGWVHIGIARRAADGENMDHHPATYDIGAMKPGTAYAVTTYRDGDPNKAGVNPLLVSLEGEVDALSESLYERLNPATRVSVATMAIHRETKVVTYTRFGLHIPVSVSA